MRILVLAGALLLASCSAERQPSNTGVYMLLDTSGTYAQELDKAEQIIRYTLSRLDATDALATAVCHHYQSSSILSGKKRFNGWSDFVNEIKGRVS